MSNVKREMFGPPTNEKEYVLASDYDACEKERDDAKSKYGYLLHRITDAEARVTSLRDALEQDRDALVRCAVRTKVLEEALETLRQMYLPMLRMAINADDPKQELIMRVKEMIEHIDRAALAGKEEEK